MNSSVVIINLGSGTLETGCPEITAQVIASERGGYPSTQVRGSLPSDLKLAELYRQWQILYREYYQEIRAIEIENSGVTHFSELEFRELCEQFQSRFNEWLNSATFAPIDRRLSRFLSPDQEIQIIITTDDSELRRLPWHLWNLLTDYPYAEVVLSGLEYYQKSAEPVTATGKVRILAVFGEAEGLDLKRDRAEIETLPGAESYFLEQPNNTQFNEYLWEKQGWDILFFAGHSYTQNDRGHLYLNSQTTISLDCFHHALKTAIANGLKLAIFNSCDGLGLTKTLGELGLPCAIVMREAIPNPVAEEFFQQFLIAFAGGKSLHLAIREARERLEKLEQSYPCASWLPVLCQPPTMISASWQKWQGEKGLRGWFKKRSLRETAFLWGFFGALGTQTFLRFNPLEWWLLLSLWQETKEEKVTEVNPEKVLRVVTEENYKKGAAIAQLLTEKTLNIDLIEEITTQPIDLIPSTKKLTSGTYQIQVEIVQEDNNLMIYSFQGIVDLEPPTIITIKPFALSRSSPRFQPVLIEFSEAIDPDSFDQEDVRIINDTKTELTPSSLTIEPISERIFALKNIRSSTEKPETLELKIDLKGVRDRAGNQGKVTVSTVISSNSDDPENEPELPPSNNNNDQETPTSPPEEDTVIRGKTTIILEKSPADMTVELPSPDAGNEDFSNTLSNYTLSAWVWLETEHFHFSVETSLVISPHPIEDSLPLLLTLSETELAETYDTVLIEEETWQFSNNYQTITPQEEDYLFSVSDAFEIEEAERDEARSRLTTTVTNSLNFLPTLGENSDSEETLFPEWTHLQLITRLAFNEEWNPATADQASAIAQMNQSLLDSANILNNNLQEEQTIETKILATGDFINAVSDVGLDWIS